jgi:hypothetical protein
MNGNMEKMIDKGIANIAYNHLNLPTGFYMGMWSEYPVAFESVYRSDGTKQRKQHMRYSYDFVSYIGITDYLDSFQYFKSEKFSNP